MAQTYTISPTITNTVTTDYSDVKYVQKDIIIGNQNFISLIENIKNNLKIIK